MTDSVSNSSDRRDTDELPMVARPPRQRKKVAAKAGGRGVGTSSRRHRAA